MILTKFCSLSLFCSLSTFTSGNVSKNWAVCMHVRLHVYAFTCERKQQNNSVPIFPVWGEVWEPYFDVVQHSLSSWSRPPPRALGACGELWHWPDLECHTYLLCICLWTCCSRCPSDNMWIKLSLTHHLRKGIQVQARHLAFLPSSLSLIKLIL